MTAPRALAVLLLAGCATAESMVRTRASRDFSCEPEAVAVELRERLHVARGCGQSNGYAITGEWFSTWAVPCTPGKSGAFTAAPADLCADAGF